MAHQKRSILQLTQIWILVLPYAQELSACIVGLWVATELLYVKVVVNCEALYMSPYYMKNDSTAFHLLSWVCLFATPWIGVQQAPFHLLTCFQTNQKK